MKEVLFSICVTAVITAVYKMIAPTEKFGSQIKLLVSCFFILSVIGAVSGTGITGDLLKVPEPDTLYNDYSVQINRMTADETAKNMKRIIGEKLSAENIFPEKIYVDINISSGGSISISEIKLVFDRQGYELYAARAVTITRQCTGAAVKVTAEMSSVGTYVSEGSVER